MKQLDKYIGKTVFSGILLVLFILVSLFIFFSLIDEIRDIGVNKYGSLEAFKYILLHTPRYIYQLFPVSALLGCLIGLSILANNNELTIMRAAGISIVKILTSAIKVVLLLTIIVMLLGEYVAPYSEQYANNMRSAARSENISLKTRYGFWVRDGLDFINVRMIFPQGDLGEIYIYKYNKKHKLQQITYAKRAVYINNKWVLKNIKRTSLSTNKIVAEKIDKLNWNSSLSPKLVNILASKPENLSITELHRYINYLNKNDQLAIQYELAFWLKIVYPFSIIVMIFIATPLIFGSIRNVPISRRVLFGTLIGIGFHLLNKTINHVGILYNLNPILSASLPTIIFFALAILIMNYEHLKTINIK
jgi:lipopolysaccharide export system permease protein